MNPWAAKRCLKSGNAAHVPPISLKTATLASHQARFWQAEPWPLDASMSSQSAAHIRKIFQASVAVLNDVEVSTRVAILPPTHRGCGLPFFLPRRLSKQLWPLPGENSGWLHQAMTNELNLNLINCAQFNYRTNFPQSASTRHRHLLPWRPAGSALFRFFWPEFVPGSWKASNFWGSPISLGGPL